VAKALSRLVSPFYRYRQVFDEIEDVMNAKGAPIYQLDRNEISAVVRLALLTSGALYVSINYSQEWSGNKSLK